MAWPSRVGQPDRGLVNPGHPIDRTHGVPDDGERSVALPDNTAVRATWPSTVSLAAPSGGRETAVPQRRRRRLCRRNGGSSVWPRTSGTCMARCAEVERIPLSCVKAASAAGARQGAATALDGRRMIGQRHDTSVGRLRAWWTVVHRCRRRHPARQGGRPCHHGCGGFPVHLYHGVILTPRGCSTEIFGPAAERVVERPFAQNVARAMIRRVHRRASRRAFGLATLLLSGGDHPCPIRFNPFPGKALADLCGKPMIVHVYERGGRRAGSMPDRRHHR